MNGVHDMGGQQNHGPVVVEKNEPVFHAPWEGRMYAMNTALRAWRRWNIDGGRHGTESVPAADYLRMSYYARWYARTVELIVRTGMVTRAEIDSGRPVQGSARLVPAMNAEQARAVVTNGVNYSRDVAVAANFAVGQRVRTRNIHPTTHTRLPSYARGKTGTVERDYGVFVFPDTNAHLHGEKPQHLYLVRFAARELWGDAAKPQDALYLNMWDDYLEPA
jgi:nitrile hydratase beta subunit